ncbi:MAG: hypothetical protein ACFFCY_03275 [Promethearchaeota archaeon]
MNEILVKLVCKSCKHEEMLNYKRLEQCHQCGSTNLMIFKTIKNRIKIVCRDCDYERIFMCPLTECPQCGTPDIMISFPEIETKTRSEIIKERDIEKKKEKMNWKKKLFIIFYVILILGVIGAVIGLSLYVQNLFETWGVELPIIITIIIVIILLICMYLYDKTHHWAF